MIETFAYGETSDADFQLWVKTQTYDSIHKEVLHLIDALDERDPLSLNIRLRALPFFSREFAAAIMSKALAPFRPTDQKRVRFAKVVSTRTRALCASATLGCFARKNAAKWTTLAKR